MHWFEPGVSGRGESLALSLLAAASLPWDAAGITGLGIRSETGFTAVDNTYKY